MISARRDLDDRVARRQDRQTAMLVRAQVRAAGALPGTGPRPGPVRRNLCKALAPGAGRNAGGLGRSSPSSLRVWPRSWRTVHSARCRRGRAHRICRTRQLHAARHIVPARVHPSPRGRVRTPCRLPRAVALRNACTGQPPAVPGRAACSCHSRSCGTVRHLCRRKVCRLPWPSRTLRARPGAASRRNTGTSCDPPRAGPLRILDTCRGRGVRR